MHLCIVCHASHRRFQRNYECVIIDVTIVNNMWLCQIMLYQCCMVIFFFRRSMCNGCFMPRASHPCNLERICSSPALDNMKNNNKAILHTYTSDFFSVTIHFSNTSIIGRQFSHCFCLKTDEGLLYTCIL